MSCIRFQRNKVVFEESMKFVSTESYYLEVTICIEIDARPVVRTSPGPEMRHLHQILPA